MVQYLVRLATIRSLAVKPSRTGENSVTGSPEDAQNRSAYDLFLRAVWRRVQSSADDAISGPLADELRQQGASEDTIQRLLKKSLAAMAWDLCYLIDSPDGSYFFAPPHNDVTTDDPRWQLSEVRPDGSLTGETIAGLHECYLQADPTGTEGSDWGI
jgi:hypothetical protein